MYFPFKILIKTIVYNCKFFFSFKKKNNNLNFLQKNGYLHLKNSVGGDLQKLTSKYTNYKNYDFVFDRKKINKKDLKIIFEKLDNLNIFEILKTYLENNIYSYDNTILTLGNKTSKEGAWQPHHDSKGNRIKIYIWLNKLSTETHPLFYLRGSHKKIRIWSKYKQTRFSNISEVEMDKIYGDIGDIIIFDTHGIHSNFKKTIQPRSVIELTFGSFGFFSRFNDKTIKGKKEIERIQAIPMNLF